jgi:hypothetical protein
MHFGRFIVITPTSPRNSGCSSMLATYTSSSPTTPALTAGYWPHPNNSRAGSSLSNASQRGFLEPRHHGAIGLHRGRLRAPPLPRAGGECASLHAGCTPPLPRFSSAAHAIACTNAHIQSMGGMAAVLALPLLHQVQTYFTPALLACRNRATRSGHTIVSVLSATVPLIPSQRLCAIPQPHHQTCTCLTRP